jgi:hypothetical protein
VKKLIAICPIEFDHYSEIDTNPLLLREEAELSAMYLNKCSFIVLERLSLS